jgi:hypothetical protein
MPFQNNKNYATRAKITLVNAQKLFDIITPMLASLVELLGNMLTKKYYIIGPGQCCKTFSM